MIWVLIVVVENPEIADRQLRCREAPRERIGAVVRDHLHPELIDELRREDAVPGPENGVILGARCARRTRSVEVIRSDIGIVPVLDREPERKSVLLGGLVIHASDPILALAEIREDPMVGSQE